MQQNLEPLISMRRQKSANSADIIAETKTEIAQSNRLTRTAKSVVESKERELRMIRESNERESTMDELLRPLNQEKQEVMRNLLESVQTNRLKNAFEKYLPAVLEDRSVKARKVIAESVTSVTGDKTVLQSQVSEDRSNVIDLKRLAGL
jgi:chemotaxis regulatin CheY-phosphate phosphatase CheZ